MYRVMGRGSGPPPANYMGLMGQERDKPAPKGLVHPPIRDGQIGVEKSKEERKKGIGFPLPPLPFLLRIGIGKGEGRIGRTPSRIPPTWGAPLAASPPLQPIYMRGGTARTHNKHCLPCAAPPSIVYASGHIHVVLRRSPARITSPSPSPRDRTDGTLPRHFARSRVREMSSS